MLFGGVAGCVGSRQGRRHPDFRLGVLEFYRV